MAQAAARFDQIFPDLNGNGRDDVVPETPETIDNSASAAVDDGDPRASHTTLEDILTLVHRDPVLDFLPIEDLLQVGVCDRGAMRHVQAYLTTCGNEAFFGIFDLVKYFLQVNVILRIRNKLSQGSDDAAADDEGAFYERKLVISYVTGSLYNDGPVNPIAPSRFSTDFYFVNYLRQLYPTHQKRNWHFPFPDNNELFKDFNHFMRTQLTNLDPLFLKLSQYWWWNKRFEYIWSFMHQPTCGLCGDNMNLNARKAKTICKKCEDPGCRTIGGRVIVCGPCVLAQKERIRKERREEQQRRWMAEMEERRRQIDRLRRERYTASKRQRLARGPAERSSRGPKVEGPWGRPEALGASGLRPSPARRLRFDDDDDNKGQGQAQAPGQAAGAPEMMRNAAYACPLADADCTAYGHQGQQCPCECHTNALGFFPGDAA